MQVETMRFNSAEEMEQEIDDLLDEGGSLLTGMWQVQSQSDTKATFVKHAGLGDWRIHAVLFVLTIWWLPLIANLCYAGSYYFFQSKQVKMQVKRSA